MFISICVCTYNRAHILPHCLESLTCLQAPLGCNFEILIIDNNSTDNTKDVVERYSAQSQRSLAYCREVQQGLSAARNRAIKEARGEYLAFLDDECVVASDWLEVIAEDIAEFSPKIIGGPYVGALLPGTAPKWFKTEYGDAYFLAENFERGYQQEFKASGGNMVLHRSVFESKKFDRRFGHKGNELGFGEEILLQQQFLNENADAMVFYEPRMQVTHYILPNKMSLAYHAKRQIELGACHVKIPLAVLPFALARAATRLCVFPLQVTLRDRKAYPYWQNYAYEAVIPRVMPVFGATIERFRRRY